MNITKKTAFGATAAAAALVVVGAAAPAMASDNGDWSSYAKSFSRTSTSHQTTDTVVAPDVDILGGGVLNGDVLGGNDVSAPVLSGNDTAIGSGNDTAIGNVSGNSVDGNSVGNVDTEVSDLVDNATGTSVSDLVDVDDILGDIGGWVDLDGMFED
ncbi:MAG: hypothetical protein JWR04_2030 [Rhodoglobus sp.]|nr:hypothetical protein [Rhodoglobus sp.]